MKKVKNDSAFDAVTTAPTKKPFYKKKWVIALAVALAIIGMAGGSGTNDYASAQPANDKSAATEVSETADVDESATAEAEKADEETQAEAEKTPLEEATEMGRFWFQSIDWSSAFAYSADVHYIADYRCSEVTDESLTEYGQYVAVAGADLTNGYGAKFSSHIYIFMDGDGVVTHVFYEEASGDVMELPLDSLATVY